MGLPLGADLEEAHTAPQHAINGHFHGTSVLLAAANATGPACTDNAGYTGHNTALWTETSIGVNGFLWNKTFFFKLQTCLLRLPNFCNTLSFLRSFTNSMDSRFDIGSRAIESVRTDAFMENLLPILEEVEAPASSRCCC